MGEHCRLAKPDHFGNRCEFTLDEHTGRIAIRVLLMVSVGAGEIVSRVIPARLRASVLAIETSGKGPPRQKPQIERM
jgi:hypothetical protein